MADNMIGYRAEDLQFALRDKDGSQSLFFKDPKGKLQKDVACIRAFNTLQWFFFQLMMMREHNGSKKRIVIAIALDTLFPTTAFKRPETLASLQASWDYTMAMCVRFHLQVLVIDSVEREARKILLGLYPDIAAYRRNEEQQRWRIIDSEHLLKNTAISVKPPGGQPWAVYDPRDTAAVTRAGGYAIVKVI